MRNGRLDRRSIAAAAIGLAMLGVAFAAGTVISGKPLSATTPLIATVLGFLAPVVVGLLTLLGVSNMSSRVNGGLDELVQRRVEQQLDARDAPAAGEHHSSSSSSRTRRST